MSKTETATSYKSEYCSGQRANFAFIPGSVCRGGHENESREIIGRSLGQSTRAGNFRAFDLLSNVSYSLLRSIHLTAVDSSPPLGKWARKCFLAARWPGAQPINARREFSCPAGERPSHINRETSPVAHYFTLNFKANLSTCRPKCRAKEPRRPARPKPCAPATRRGSAGERKATASTSTRC